MPLALVIPTYMCVLCVCVCVGCVCVCVFVCVFVKLYIIVRYDPVIQDCVCHIGPPKRGSIILVTKIYDHTRLRECA